MKLKKFLFGLFRSDFWYQQKLYSEEQDKLIDYIIDNNMVPVVGFATVHFGDIELWASNYPFAYGYTFKSSGERRPSRFNIYRLKKHIESHGEGSREKSGSFFEFYIHTEICTDITVEEVRLAVKEKYPEKFI